MSTNTFHICCSYHWSVTIAKGETVSIGKGPLVELYDAESPVIGVAVQDVDKVGLLIAAGC